ncbi:MAG: hypothetical protein JXR84_06600 [Anaerolineae bacterium]|nr:hypothetical protein [Anaerolineae bacterium]
MLKKIVSYGIVGLLALALIAGTVYIVLSPSETRAGQGQSRAVEAAAENESGQERGREQSDTTTGNGYRGDQNDAPVGDGIPINSALLTVHGTATEVDNDVILSTESGDLLVGLGPAHYREQAGFVISSGDELEISGFNEDEEFKAVSVQNLTNGMNIILRDSGGHPMWAGQGNLRNQP